MEGYLYEFSKHEIGGRSLLSIRPYELEDLGMQKIGHQEIVLEAVESLRHFVSNCYTVEVDTKIIYFLICDIRFPIGIHINGTQRKSQI